MQIEKCNLKATLNAININCIPEMYDTIKACLGVLWEAKKTELTSSAVRNFNIDLDLVIVTKMQENVC